MLSIIANSAWNESEFLQYMQYTHSYNYGFHSEGRLGCGGSVKMLHTLKWTSSRSSIGVIVATAWETPLPSSRWYRSHACDLYTTESLAL